MSFQEDPEQHCYTPPHRFESLGFILPCGTIVGFLKRPSVLELFPHDSSSIGCGGVFKDYRERQTETTEMLGG